MKILLVTTLAFSAATAMAADSEKTLFEMSAARMAKIATAEAEAQTAPIKSVLSILESDRPALKATGVNTEGRDLKAEAAASTKAL